MSSFWAKSSLTFSTTTTSHTGHKRPLFLKHHCLCSFHLTCCLKWPASSSLDISCLSELHPCLFSLVVTGVIEHFFLCLSVVIFPGQGGSGLAPGLRWVTFSIYIVHDIDTWHVLLAVLLLLSILYFLRMFLTQCFPVWIKIVRREKDMYSFWGRLVIDKKPSYVLGGFPLTAVCYRFLSM